MMPSLRSVRFAGLALAPTFALMASAQAPLQPTPTTTGKLSMTAAVGSFKMVPHSDEDPVKGHLEMSFSGTVLVSGLAKDGHIAVSGKVHEEYNDTKHMKTIYFGTGKIVMDGTVRSIQWFGHDLSATFSGRAIVRFYGEYDRKGDTGDYWFGGLADKSMKKFQWGTYGNQAECPTQRPDAGLESVPTPRKSGGG